MKEYGTHVVGGTSPGKGGTDVDGIPVFNTMYDAVEQTKANTSIIFVPARFAADAIMEAADAGIRLIVCIAEGIPTLDVIKAHQFVEQKGAMLIGPNCPGLISPGKSMVGILPGQVFLEGNVGVISRSGTLTYEIVYHLTANGMGQSTAIGIGGDPVVGLHFRQLLEMFQNDPETEAIVLIGEIGGNAEEQAAEYIMEYSLLYAIRQHTGYKCMVQILPPEEKQPQHPLGMARIINAKEVLQIYAAAFPEDEMQLELSDKQLSVNNGYYYLCKGKCMYSTERLPGTHIQMNISELTNRILQPLKPYMSLMLN